MADPARDQPSPTNEDPQMPRHATRREWEALHPDPDLRDDLGYELLDLEAHETDDGHVLFLPRDEDMIREEAFIIVRRDLIERVDE